MAIVQKRPLAPPDVKPAIPRIEPVRNQSVVIDTKYTPRSSLLKYIEGSPWTVTYYSQFLNHDNATYSQDPGQEALYQQYKKIEHLELRVDTPLNTQQDQQSKGFTVKGSAILPMAVIPNEGDMFAADVGDGRLGIFQIDNSEKRSIYKESAYFIEYTMMYYADKESDRYKDLEKKVICTYHYVKQFAQYGQNALVTTSEYKALLDIQRTFRTLKAQYFKWFYSKEFATLVVPEQGNSVYDSYLIKAIKALYVSEDAPEFKFMRALNIEDDNYLKLHTVWDALLQRDGDILQWCEKQMGTVSTKGFNNDPMMETIHYSGLASIVYPKYRNKAIDHSVNYMQKSYPILDVKATSSLVESLDAISDADRIQVLGKDMTIVHPVTIDDYYIFSENFYRDLPDKSVLEVVTQNYLQNEANDPILIYKLLKNSWKWGAIERFYYIPVLFILTMDIVKSIN